MGGPAGVADAHVPMHGVASEYFGEARQFAHTATDVESAGVVDGNPSRVIAAIFQARQPIDNQRGRLTRPDISHNSTHWLLLFGT